MPDEALNVFADAASRREKVEIDDLVDLEQTRIRDESLPIRVNRQADLSACQDLVSTLLSANADKFYIGTTTHAAQRWLGARHNYLDGQGIPRKPWKGHRKRFREMHVITVVCYSVARWLEGALIKWARSDYRFRWRCRNAAEACDSRGIAKGVNCIYLCVGDAVKAERSADPFKDDPSSSDSSAS